MKSRRIELSTSQVAASVLATITGTVMTSFLGVAGTLIGAAVISVVSTAGAAVYRYYLGRTGERLRSIGPVVVSHTRVAGQGLREVGRLRVLGSAGGEDHPGHSSDGDPSDHDPLTTQFPAVDPSSGGRAHRPDAEGEASRGVRWKSRWLMLAGVSAGIFVVVIGGITLVEAMAGKPVSNLVWHKNGSGTTVGDAVEGGTSQRGPSPSPSPSPSTTPSTPVRSSVTPHGQTVSPTSSASLPGTPASTPSSPAPTPSPSLSPPPPSAGTPTRPSG